MKRTTANMQLTYISVTSVKRILKTRFVCFLTANISFSEEINTQKACMQSRLRYNNTH
jgi:hypothetical protein